MFNRISYQISRPYTPLQSISCVFSYLIWNVIQCNCHGSKTSNYCQPHARICDSFHGSVGYTSLSISTFQRYTSLTFMTAGKEKNDFTVVSADHWKLQCCGCQSCFFFQGGKYRFSLLRVFSRRAVCILSVLLI